MKPIKFKVNTDLSDRRRTVKVVVHQDKDSFDKANLALGEEIPEALQRTRDQVPSFSGTDNAEAATHSKLGYELSDHVATIHFRTDIPLTINAVVHEVTHAAITIYSMDRLQLEKKSKALKHLNHKNELLPHLVGEITTTILRKLRKPTDRSGGCTVMSRKTYEAHLEARRAELQRKLTEPLPVTYGYTAQGPDEDGEYCGACNRFPSLSWFDATPEKALNSIQQLVAGVLDDLDSCKCCGKTELDVPFHEDDYCSPCKYAYCDICG